MPPETIIGLRGFVETVDKVLSGAQEKYPAGTHQAEKPGEGKQIQPHVARGAHSLPEIFSYCGMPELENALYLTMEPHVFVPGGGHVEIDAYDDVAIVRVYDAAGVSVETRNHCTIVREANQIRIVASGETNA